MNMRMSWFATLLIFYLGFFITRYFINIFPVVSHQSVLGAKTYTAPSAFSAKPSSPDFYKSDGGTINRERVTVVAFPNTVDVDSYLSVGITPKVYPIKLCKRYQISSIYELWFKSQENDARILNPFRTSIVTLRFNSDDLLTDSGEYFPMDSLKLAFSPDGGYTWTTLRSSVVDVENKTVSAISRINGGYMLVAGYSSNDSYCNYKQVN